MCHLQVNDEIAQRDFHLAKVVIGKKTWDHFDSNIMLWSDRGKGRAKIIRYRRGASSKDPRTHNYLHIARIVMGAHLVGFLIIIIIIIY